MSYFKFSVCVINHSSTSFTCKVVYHLPRFLVSYLVAVPDVEFWHAACVCQSEARHIVVEVVKAVRDVEDVVRKEGPRSLKNGGVGSEARTRIINSAFC